MMRKIALLFVFDVRRVISLSVPSVGLSRGLMRHHSRSRSTPKLISSVPLTDRTSKRTDENIESGYEGTLAEPVREIVNFENNTAQLQASDTDTIIEVSNEETSPSTSPKNRFLQSLPKIGSGGDSLDRSILLTAIPSMINLAVVPIVNTVDTFWVGRMGSALALAGQAAANQAFFTLYFLVAFLPTITAPLVAKAVGSGDMEAARSRVCEALFLGSVLGGLGTLLLVGFPRMGLSMVLPSDAPALAYAAPYLRWRALSMIPALVSATGFAAYRGLLNTVTPLKVSLATNAINLVLDPLVMFTGGMGFVGAALATATAEMASGLTYLKLLLRKKLVKWSLIIKPPSMSSLLPLLRGGIAMLVRQAALNVGYVTATRRAQSMDPTGVAAAAYGIVMQMYYVGIVIHVALQSTAAALVPSALAKRGKDEARVVADRIFTWSSIVGVLLALTQWLATPLLVPVFSTLPEVQEAVRLPALIASMVHVINGPAFAGEGVMMGTGTYKALTTVTSLGIGTMVAFLASPLGKRLDGILISMASFCLLQSVLVVTHYLRWGPLSRSKKSLA